MLLPEFSDRLPRLRDILRRELVARRLDGEWHTWNKWMKRIHDKKSQVFRTLVVRVSIHHRMPPLETRAHDDFEIGHSFVTTFPDADRIALRSSETDQLVASLVPSRLVLARTLILRALTWHTSERDLEFL